MPIGLKIILIVILVLAVLTVIGWIGLRITPAPFEPFPQPSSGPAETIPLPDGLPAPVERFYRTVYGDQIPVIESAVISGRGRMRPAGPFYLPVRYRFTHDAGQGYRHYIEATFFGLPVLKINERYVDGVGRMELPFGTVEDDPKVNQGGNLGLWAESMWLSPVYLTDARVRWAPVDDVTALLIVPFEDTEETFVVRFDPETGLPSYLESMRYQGAESNEKTLWLNEVTRWGEMDGHPFMQDAALIWINQREPWALLTAEEIVYNVDVSEYIRARGQ